MADSEIRFRKAVGGGSRSTGDGAGRRIPDTDGGGLDRRARRIADEAGQGRRVGLRPEDCGLMKGTESSKQGLL
jgi:hypothetical protein